MRAKDSLVLVRSLSGSVPALQEYSVCAASYSSAVSTILESAMASFCVSDCSHMGFS